MKRFRHNPSVVEAVRVEYWNVHDVAEWCGGFVEMAPGVEAEPAELRVMVPTRHGDRPAALGWWIIRRRDHPPEHYPVHPEVHANEYTAETNGD